MRAGAGLQRLSRARERARRYEEARAVVQDVLEAVEPQGGMMYGDTSGGYDRADGWTFDDQREPIGFRA